MGEPNSGAGTSADGVPERYTCSICLDLLCQPAQPPCGHVYCEHCIRGAVMAQLQARRVVTCPLCRAAFAPGALAVVFLGAFGGDVFAGLFSSTSRINSRSTSGMGAAGCSR